MLTRREMIAAGIASLVRRPARAFAQPATAPASEEQKGDPDLEYETVTYDPAELQLLFDRSGKAKYEEWQPTLPKELLEVSRSFIGASRTKTPDRISPLLELFNMALKQNGNDVPYCAAGVSFCALTAFARRTTTDSAPGRRTALFRGLAGDIEHYYFYPTVSCNDMALVAKGKRHFRDATVVPKPGWIVLFDWGSRGRPDHCGVVESASATSLFTVEFNTSVREGNQRNGGVVADKERTTERQFVYGYIATDIKPGAI